MATYVHPTAVIDEDVTLGDGAKVWHFCHLMPGCEIGAGCSLGQNVFVAPGVKLGEGCKVQNNVSLFAGVICEPHVFIGPSVVFTNILNPRAEFPRRGSYIPTPVGRGASIGANATVVCGNRIGEYAMIGAGSVVTKDVADYALVVGNPARRIGYVSRAGHKLDFGVAAGRANCPETGEAYRLTENGEVVRA